MFVPLVRIVVFSLLRKPRDIWRPELNFAGHGDRDFKNPMKSGLSWEDKDERGHYIYKNIPCNVYCHNMHFFARLHDGTAAGACLSVCLLQMLQVYNDF
jgi:hypothetical protein